MNLSILYRFTVGAVAWLFGAQLCVADPIALQSGQPVQFALAANSFTSSFFIDLDNQAQQLTIAINGTSGDADLYLRYGTPFADSTFLGTAPDSELFTRYAHYYSGSALSRESIVVTKASREPLRNGRWYIVVSNVSSSPSTVTLTATVANSQTAVGLHLDFDSPSSRCDTAPWNDTTPASPVGGNPGTTLGQQRRNALQYAADLLAQQLSNPISVTVHACWEHLGGDSNSATLAHAGPANLLLGDTSSPLPWLSEHYTWYAAAEAMRLGGVAQCGMVASDCTDPDIEAGFNADIGSASVLGGISFYLGYNPGPAGSGEDFVAIAMHELTHGLGFIGLVNDDPTLGTVGIRFTGLGSDGYSGQPGYDDIFDKKIAAVNADTGLFKGFLSDTTSDAERATALVSGNGLRWSDSEAVTSSINRLSNLDAPDSFPLLYAPCIRDTPGSACQTTPGSTLSHTVQSGDLMNAFYQLAARTMGLSLPMLHALGFSNDNAPIPTYTQPIPSNWYDRTRNGHGIDFRLGFHDAALGDVYFLNFYTYDNSGNPELYTASGHLVDGVFVPGKDSNGLSLFRLRYNPATHRAELDLSGGGNMILDFNQARNSPACRNVDRNGALQLAVMDWQLGSESGQWCMEPIVPLSAHATPDFNGDWYGGPNDAGWGIAVIYVNDGSGPPSMVVIMYYPDGLGALRWAIGDVSDYVSGQSITLQQVSGYCRNCPAPAALSGTAIGQVALTLNQPLQESTPSGINTISLNVTYPGTTGSFIRTNTPLTLLSAPTGH